MSDNLLDVSQCPENVNLEHLKKTSKSALPVKNSFRNSSVILGLFISFSDIFARNSPTIMTPSRTLTFFDVVEFLG